MLTKLRHQVKAFIKRIIIRRIVPGFISVDSTCTNPIPANVLRVSNLKAGKFVRVIVKWLELVSSTLHQ